MSRLLKIYGSREAVSVEMKRRAELRKARFIKEHGEQAYRDKMTDMAHKVEPGVRGLASLKARDPERVKQIASMGGHGAKKARKVQA